jgi:LemA protein
MNGLMIFLIVVLAVVLIFLMAFMFIYNEFVKSKNKVEEAFSTMDVYLKKRYDLIPNLVETVKGYAKHESETLEKVIQARNSVIGAKSEDEKIKGNATLTSSLKSLFALAENYPDLKADSSFINLQQNLTKLEEDISQSRKYYNAVVKDYNIKIEAFPSNIVAKMLKYSKKPMYEIDETQRDNVKVQF